MAIKTPLTVGGNKVAQGHFQTIPLPPPLLPFKHEHIKVRLYFLTNHPLHIRSVQLKEDYGFQPPYTEEACILIPQAKVYNLLETFLPAFERLKTSQVIPMDAQLQSFQIIEEDNLTLSFLFS